MQGSDFKFSHRDIKDTPASNNFLLDITENVFLFDKIAKKIKAGLLEPKGLSLAPLVTSDSEIKPDDMKSIQPPFLVAAHSTVINKKKSDRISEANLPIPGGDLMSSHFNLWNTRVGIPYCSRPILVYHRLTLEHLPIQG